MNLRNNPRRIERAQQKIDAGIVSAHFPGVASIVISMMYNQRGISKSVPRVVNFFPSSYAFFRVDCLSKNCDDGGFDLTQVITTMINNRRGTEKGELSCGSTGSCDDQSAITYKVAIQYT
ncbi:MAG: hypothetical protein HY757_03000 [Nitrospirae bacterium]|nr:hypothetical protein [Nitrospirota bacterium]